MTLIRRGVRPPDGSELTQDAHIGGELVVGREVVCASGRRGAPTHLAPGYSLAARGDEGRVLDDGGHIVVGVRGCVTAGGGETRTGEAWPEYCQRRRELDPTDGCKGLCGGWLPDTRDRVLTTRISL